MESGTRKLHTVKVIYNTHDVNTKVKETIGTFRIIDLATPLPGTNIAESSITVLRDFSI